MESDTRLRLKAYGWEAIVLSVTNFGKILYIFHLFEHKRNAGLGGEGSNQCQYAD